MKLFEVYLNTDCGVHVHVLHTITLDKLRGVPLVVRWKFCQRICSPNNVHVCEIGHAYTIFWISIYYISSNILRLSQWIYLKNIAWPEYLMVFIPTLKVMSVNINFPLEDCYVLPFHKICQILFGGYFVKYSHNYFWP